MNKPLPPISLGRAEAAEILDLISPITKALEGLPYREATAPIGMIDAIRETICEAVPGGFAGLCESCGLPTGQDEVSGYTDDGSVFCPNCSPDADFSEIEAGDVDKVDRERFVVPAGRTEISFTFIPRVVPEGVSFEGNTGHGWTPRFDPQPLDGTGPVNRREDGEFGEGATIVSERRVPRYDPPADPYAAAHEAEELQLLRAILACGGMVKTSHSATKTIALRLDRSADVMVYLTAGPSAIGSGMTIAVELTAKGKRRLDAAGGA